MMHREDRSYPEGFERQLMDLSRRESRAREAAIYLMTCLHGAASKGWTRKQIATLAKTCREQWPEFFPGTQRT